MLNIGLISKWHVHAGGYAKHIQENDLGNIAAVWDEDPARGADWAAELGAAFYADYDAFLAAGIDAVVCDSPTTMHGELLVQAARAGKHIFTEKMLAPTTREAEAIAEAVRAAGVTFAISLPEKSSRAVLYVKQLMQSGKLGRVTAARFRRSHGGVSGGWLPEYWFDVNASGGGALMDLGAHPVYIMADFFGAPKRLTALMTNLYGTSSDENTIVLAEFGDGVLATMETAFVTGGVPDQLEIFGTEGSVFMRGGEVVQNIGSGMEAVPAEALPMGKDSPLTQFMRAVAAGAKEPEGLGLEDALLMTRIAEAAYEAQRTGRTLAL